MEKFLNDYSGFIAIAALAIAIFCFFTKENKVKEEVTEIEGGNE